MSIEVKGVTKKYEEQKALDNVSFTIKEGEVVGFLGPNGAGKSTMMKIITCFIPPTEGIVDVCGYNVDETPIEVKKRVGYLPENNPLYLEMYVKEYLHFVAGLHHIKNKKQRVKELIDIVKLEVEQNKLIGQLSKGYRQRVGIAQAMLHDPEVLVLDEPTSGLDPNQLVEIREVIKNIGKEKTVMLSTHIMQEVEAVCDRVIIVNKGKIVADDRAENLKKINAGDFIIIAEFAESLELNQLKRIEGVKKVKKIGANTWRFTSKEGQDIRNNIFQFSVNQKLTVLTIRKEETNLKAVFKKYTSEQQDAIES